MKLKLLKPALAGMLALTTAIPAAAIERNPYFGLSAGISKLSPDVGSSGLTLDKDTSTAVAVTLGVPVTQRFNAELGYSQLGTAELSNGDIGYSAFSLGAVAYVLGNGARLSNQSGLRAYLRLGFNLMDNDTDIRLKEADNTAIWFGAGLEWPLATRFSIRGEVSSFDGDAQAFSVALLFQPGARRSRTSTAVNSPVIAPTPQVQPAPEPVPMPEPAVRPAPKSGVLSGVEFESGTAILTSIGESVLAQLATSMQVYPKLTIEIGAHTNGVKGDVKKVALTRARAIAVARFLASNGVSIQRMTARAFGANVPRAAGDSAGARRLNNRVEITVR